MSRRTVVGGVVCAFAISALVAGVTTATADAQAAPAARAKLANSAPSWLGHAKHTGQAAASSAVTARVYLAPKGGVAALQKAVAAVSTPGSASYRHFMTVAQYDAAFEPTTASVNSVSAWLRSSGLKVTGVEADHRFVDVTGTVSAAQSAFGVSIQRYSHDGQNVQSPSGAASIPTALASTVLTVSGLDTTHVVHTTNAAQPTPAPPAGFANARPCSIYYGQLAAKTEGDFTTKLPKFNGEVPSYAPCGYTGPQFRAAYEGNTTLDGKGVTVATTLWYASPTIASDIETYADNHGDGSYGAKQFTQAKAPKFDYDDACDPTGVATEEALDLEAIHAMAPAAKLRYYPAKSCFDNDLIDDLASTVTDDKAQIVSSSWGGTEEGASAGSIPAYEQVFMQGAMEGISFMFSSGDDGDEVATTALKQADFPVSDPYVTGVGGTTTGIDANGAVSFQTGWGTDKFSLSANGKSWTPLGFLYGSGGGYSALFNRPTYQNGVVATSAPAGRAVPDVAMDADPTTGMLIGLTQTFPDGVHYGEFREGGTSLASPLFAGMTALTLQHAGGSVGLLNPTIYSQAKTSFTDVAGTPPTQGAVRPDFANSLDPSGGILYSVRTFDQDSSLTVTPGWDDVTGVGVPSPAWLTSVKPAS